MDDDKIEAKIGLDEVGPVIEMVMGPLALVGLPEDGRECLIMALAYAVVARLILMETVETDHDKFWAGAQAMAEGFTKLHETPEDGSEDADGE